MMSVIESLQYERVEEGDNVFTYGDLGDKFYIILKGSVSVQTPVVLET
jgi:CRP-like cAMP-binding protein